MRFILLFPLVICCSMSGLSAQDHTFSWTRDTSMINNPCGEPFTTSQYLANITSDTLEVTVEFTADHPSTIATINNAPFTTWTGTMLPGKGLPVRVTFYPVSGGRHRADLTARAAGRQDTGRRYVVLNALAPDLLIFPQTHNFGAVAVGSRDSMTLRIEHADRYFPIVRITLEGASSEFTVDRDTLLVRLDTTERITVYFAPASEGPREAVFVVRGPCYERRFEVRGEGTLASVGSGVTTDPLSLAVTDNSGSVAIPTLDGHRARVTVHSMAGLQMYPAITRSDIALEVHLGNLPHGVYMIQVIEGASSRIVKAVW